MEATPTPGKPRPKGPARFRRFYQVDTKGMCLLCFRECKGSQVGGRKDLSTTFCRVFLRHLKIDFYEDIVKPSNFKWKSNKVKKVGIELCQNCEYLAGAFKDIYCKLELLQMKLDQYTRTISEIMKTAGRISSRVTVYQEKMKVTGKTKGGPKSAVLAGNFRKQLMKKSLDYNKRSLRCPRVVLFKAQPTNPADIHVVPVVPTFSETLVKLRNFIFAYAFSFATVWMLTTIRGGSFPSAISLVSKKVLPFGTIVDEPVDGTSPSGDKPSISNQTLRTDLIVISDCGTTVLLPHQTIKAECTFIDESIMENEEQSQIDDSFDVIDISADEHNPLLCSPTFPLPVEAVLKLEPTESHVDLNERYCTECGIHLSCRAELEKHRALIHKWVNYVQCPICKTMFSSYSSLKFHRRDKADCALDQASETLELETIAKPIFPLATTIRGSRFCPMEGCFEVFLKQTSLEEHLKAHGLFSCQICSQQFDKAHFLALHESQHHARSAQSGYKCSRCEFHVGGQYQYMLHFISAHLKIDVFSGHCDICQKGFIGQGQALKTSKEVHFVSYHSIEGKKPEEILKCGQGQCQAYFLKPRQLEMHKMVVHHTKPDRHLTCNLCGDTAPTRSTLLKHKVQAHGHAPVRRMKSTKTYGCDKCGTQFARKFDWLLHMRQNHQQAETTTDPEVE